MNLNEAIFILGENNYIVEFLQDTNFLDYNKVLLRINKELNLNFKKLDDYDSAYISFHPKKIKNEIKNKIKNICKIFNMDATFENNYSGGPGDDIPEPNIVLYLSSNSSKDPNRIYKPVRNTRLFIHGSMIPPEIILKTGLRLRNRKEEPWQNVEGDEPRIYMSSLDVNIEYWKNINAVKLDKLANIILHGYENGMDRKYWYLIKLPKTYPILTDPEGWPGESDWVYTKHNIPPQYILYINGEADYPKATKEDIIEFITNR